MNKKYAMIAVAASMFAVSACKEAPKDPTPTVVDEPDQQREVCADGTVAGSSAEGVERCR